MTVFVTILVILALVAYAVWRAVPFVSKPWRIEVVKYEGRQAYNDPNEYVKVVLQRRFTSPHSTYPESSNQIQLGDPVSVNDDDFDVLIKALKAQAKKRIKTIKETK